MTESTIWLDNRRPVLMFMGGLAGLLLTGAALYGVFGPVLRVPGLWLLTGYLALALLFCFFFTRGLPFKVGIDGTTLVVRWVLLSARVDLCLVQRADFVVSERQRGESWDSRYYDLRLHLERGGEVNVGTIYGPVALRILDLIPKGRARLQISTRGRVIEEHDLAPSPVNAGGS